MRKRARLLSSISVLVMTIGAIFLAGKPELSSAQNAEFRSYQLLVYCGNSGVATVIFGHEVTSGGTVGRPLMGNKSLCAGNCPQGRVSIADALAGLPAEVSAALKAKVDKHQENAAAGKGRPLACLRDGKEKPKCEEQKTPPWFDTGEECDGILMGPSPSARVEPHLGYVICRISYTVCGFPGYEKREERFSMGLLKSYNRMKLKEAEKFCESKGYGENTIPYRPVCCKKWNQAYTDWIAFRRKNGPDAPGQPCNPAFDADCDGTGNEKDPTPLGDCVEYPGRPSPTPTQTPSAPTFRPTSSQIFGSELLTNPTMPMLLGFWTKTCVGSQLQSNLDSEEGRMMKPKANFVFEGDHLWLDRSLRHLPPCETVQVSI